MMHEWSLLIFTIAIPSAVGAILFLWIISGRLEKDGVDLNKLYMIPLSVLAGLSLTGLVGAFFHLGSPLAAVNMIRGFGRSWMSNEIVLAGAFIGLICLVAAFAIIYKKVEPLFLLVTGVIGLFAIYMMGAAYAYTKVNGWEHINTYLIFYGTAFTIGPVLAASLLQPALKGKRAKYALKLAFGISIFGVAVQVIGAAMFSAYLPDVQMIGRETAAAKLESYSAMIGIRWTIELIAMACLAYLSIGTTKQKISYSLVYASLAVIFVAEGMSRYVFYVMGA